MPTEILATLARLAPAARIIIMCMVLTLALLVGGAIVLAIRRRFGPSSACQAKPTGFSVDELEQMLERGQISRAEFEILRKRALGLASAPANADSSLSPPGQDDDYEKAEGYTRSG